MKIIPLKQKNNIKTSPQNCNKKINVMRATSNIKNNNIKFDNSFSNDIYSYNTKKRNMCIIKPVLLKDNKSIYINKDIGFGHHSLSPPTINMKNKLDYLRYYYNNIRNNTTNLNKINRNSINYGFKSLNNSINMNHINGNINSLNIKTSNYNFWPKRYNENIYNTKK